MLALTRLNAGFFVGGENELVFPQRTALPTAFVEIQDAGGLFGEVGVAGEDPAAVVPGAQRSRVEPAPEGGAADVGDQTSTQDLAANLGDGEAGERQAGLGGQLTSEGFDGDDELRRKTSTAGRPGAAPRDQPGGRGRSVCASC